MCSGRVDLAFIFRAFLKGADGVFLGACHLGECNYVTQGNYQALSTVHIAKKIMKNIGLDPERLRIGFMSGSEAGLYAEHVNSFIKKVKEIGPLGKAEGISEEALKFKLESVMRLIPYFRLVERERLRVRFKTEEEYEQFFSSDEVNRLFDELVIDKLAVSQIMMLLRERPLSNGEICDCLGLNPSEVSRHLNYSARQGLVWYDEGRQCFAPA